MSTEVEGNVYLVSQKWQEFIAVHGCMVKPHQNVMSCLKQWHLFFHCLKFGQDFLG